MSSPQCCDNPPTLSSSSGVGSVEDVGGFKSYISGSIDSKRAVVLVSDVYGYEAPKLRKLADKIAARGFYVVVPDFIYGDPYVPGNPEKPLLTWLQAHLPDEATDDAKTVVAALKSKGVSQIGAVGFCWGAKIVVQLAKSGDIKAAVMCHPTFVTVDDIKEIKVPTAVLGAEIDKLSPPELLKQFEEVLSTKPEVDCHVKIFPGVSHGWTVRYKDEDEVAVKCAEEAHENMLGWFTNLDKTKRGISACNLRLEEEKYRVKKQKKYAPRVLLRRPFTRSICEAYFKKYPARIGFLRVDALSLFLSLANVSAYSDVLVVDMVGGMLTGAVAERLGGTGYVCNAYLGATPYQMDIVRIFNFNNKICSRILRSPLSDLCLAQSDISEHPEPLEVASSSQFQSNIAECISSCASLPKSEDEMIEDVSGPSSNPICNEETTPKSENEMPDAVPISIDETDASSVVRPCKAAKAGEKASQQNINLWKENGFSSLIIAAPDQDAWSIVKELLPLLSYSAPFAIYHQYLQPLATCMHNLQVAKMAIGLQISEPWLREYQVLPSRTHPCMQMSAFGGYILSGTKSCNTEGQ